MPRPARPDRFGRWDLRRIGLATVMLSTATAVALVVWEAPGEATLTCTSTWVGEDEFGTWSDAASWDPAGVPGSEDVACLPAGDYQVAASGTVEIAGLVVGDAEVGPQPGLAVLAGAFSTATLTITGADGADNHGQILLGNPQQVSTSVLQVTSGTFRNHGTIEMIETVFGSFGSSRIEGHPAGNYENHGTISVTGNAGAWGCTSIENHGEITVSPSGAMATGTCGPVQVHHLGGTLTVDGTATVSGGVDVTGSAILGGSGSLTADVALEGGLREGSGTIVGDVTVDGGTLAGSGTITGDVTHQSGSVAPAGPDQFGILEVEGTYDQAAGAQLEVDIAGPDPEDDDQLAVAGPATIAGILEVAASQLPLDARNVLVAESLSGSFAEVTGVPATWITYEPTAVVVRLAPSFSDVPSEHPFYTEIEWAAFAGVTSGFPDGTFRPTTPLTRQTLIAMAYRLAGSPDGDQPACTTAPFPDVPITHPFCGEITWAADNDITNGFPDGTFGPTTTLTRQTGVAFLQRLDERDLLPS